MIEAVCHCGAVRIQAPKPEQLIECNCSICAKLGTRFAYYRPKDVRIAGPTIPYLQGDRTLETHHCAICGCTTHWAPVDPTYERMGVNARLMGDLEDVRVRRFDGADTWEFLD